MSYLSDSLEAERMINFPPLKARLERRQVELVKESIAHLCWCLTNDLRQVTQAFKETIRGQSTYINLVVPEWLLHHLPLPLPHS